MCAVLGHHERLRLGKIKDLTGVVIAAGCLGQWLGAVRAIGRQVIEGAVGTVDRAKGVPRDVPAARRLVFSTALASCGCGAASYLARR